MTRRWTDLINSGYTDIELDIASPKATGYIAGDGAIARGSDGSRWIKVGGNSTDWERLSVLYELDVSWSSISSNSVSVIGPIFAITTDGSLVFLPKNGNATDTGSGVSWQLVINTSSTINIQRNSSNTTLDTSSYQWNGNTTTGSFNYLLPSGTQGQSYKIVNVGISGNLLTVTPSGSQNLLGENSAFSLNDNESLTIAFDATDGWS